MFATEKSLKDNGYKVTANNDGTFTATKDGITKTIYPYSQDGYVFSQEDINNMFATEKSLKDNGYSVVANNDGTFTATKDGITKTIYPYSQDGYVFSQEDINNMFATEKSLKDNGYKVIANNDGSFKVTDNKGHTMSIYPDKNGKYDAANVKETLDAWENLEKDGKKVTYNEKDGSFTIKKDNVSMKIYRDKNGKINEKEANQLFDTKYELSKKNKVEEKTDKSGNLYFKVTKDGHTIKIYPYDKNGKYVKNASKIADKTFNEWNKLEKAGKNYKVVSSSNGKLLIQTADNKKFEVDIFAKGYNADGVSKIYNNYSALVKKGHKVNIKYDNNGYVYYEIDGKKVYPFDSNGKWNFDPNNPFGSGNNEGGNFESGNYGGGNGGYGYGSSAGVGSYGSAVEPINTGEMNISQWELETNYSKYVETDGRPSWLPESLYFVADYFNNFVDGISNMFAYIWESIFGKEQMEGDGFGTGPVAVLNRFSNSMGEMSSDDITEFEYFGMLKYTDASSGQEYFYFKDLKGYDEDGNETTESSEIAEFRNDNVIWKKEIVDGNEIWFCYINNNGKTGDKLMMLQEEPVEEGSSQTQYVFRDLKNKIYVDSSDYSKLVPIAYASDTGTITLRNYSGNKIVNDKGEAVDFVDPGQSIPTSQAMYDFTSNSFIYTGQDYANMVVKFASDPDLRDLVTQNVEGFGEDNPFCPNGNLNKDSLDFIETFFTTIKYDEENGNPYVRVRGEEQAYPLMERDNEGNIYILKDGEKVFVKKEDNLGYVIEASDILKQAKYYNNDTGINQLKGILQFYENMGDKDVDNINTIYCTLNLDPQENGSNQLYIRPNIQHHKHKNKNGDLEGGLTSDNIRIMFQFTYRSVRTDNGDISLNSEPLDMFKSEKMDSKAINDAAIQMQDRLDYEYSFIEHMTNYDFSFGIFNVPGTDLLQLANIEIPSNILDKNAGKEVIISNEAWTTIREQGLTNKGKNTWVYGQEVDAGMFFNFLFKDTGPDKFIAEHTHSALISFGGYFYLFIGAVIGYRALKRIVKGLKKIKGFFTNKVSGDSDRSLSSKNIYEKIDALQLEGTTVEDKIKNIETNYPEAYREIMNMVGLENKEAIENEIKEKTKGVEDTEKSLNAAVKQVLKNEVKNAQFYILADNFNKYEQKNAKVWINTALDLDKENNLIEESDSHIQLLKRMIDTGLVTFDDLQYAFKNVDETKTGEIGPMNQFMEILLGKAVENEYEKIAKYLPADINNNVVKNHILELRGRLYNQILVEPELINSKGEIENGSNKKNAIQMSQQNLREMIVANILMLRPSVTENKLTLGSDTIPSTLNLTRLILNDIDSGNASPQKTEKRIKDFITFTKYFVEFNSLFKQLSTEPSSPTNVDWLEQVEESNFYKDTDHIQLFLFLDTDQILYGDRNIKDIDIFNLTKEDLETQFKVKGENVTLFGNVLGLKDFKQIKNEDGTLNLIASINNYLKKNDGVNNEIYFAFGKAINEDIKNIERILEGDSELSRYEDFATTQQEKAIDRAINGRTFRGTKIGSNSIFDNCHMDIDDYIYNKGSANYDRFTKSLDEGGSALFSLLNKNGIISKSDVKIELDLGEVMREYVLNKKDGKEPNLQTKRVRITNLRTAIQNDLDNNKIIDNKDSAEAMIKGLENLETNYGQTFFLRFLNGLSVYKRFLKDIAGFSFWNIETRQQKIATYLLMGVFASLTMAVFLFATPIGASLVPVIVSVLGKTVVGNIILSSTTSVTGAIVSAIGSSAAGSAALSFISSAIGAANYDIIMTLIVSGLLLPKMIVGRATDGGMKRNILGLTAAFSVYYGGFLGGFFIRGIAISLFPGAFPIFAILTIGISFAVWLFIGIPTFASFWHIMIGTKSSKIEKEKNKELTAHNDMEKRISWQKRATLAFGIGGVAGIGWLTSLIFSFLVTPIAPPFMLMVLGVISVFFIAGGIMSLWSRRYVGDTDRPENFGKLHIRDVYELCEQSDNPEMFMSDIRANVEIAYNRLWISQNERENILKAYSKIEEAVRNGKSVKDIEKEIEQEIGIENLSPKKVEIREMFKQYFLAYSVEKEAIPDWSKIPATGEHVQAYSEQGRWTIEDILARGDFHKGTSQFTRLASKFKESFWANACERIDDIMKENEGIEEYDKLNKLVNTLKNIEETSEVQTIEELGLQSEKAKEVYNEILGVACTFMESTLGSQETVAETMYEDHVQFYKTLALDQGDLRYAKIANKINVVYGTLNEAIADNGAKIINNKIDDRKITKEDFEYFKEKFEIYAPEVEKKHKIAITDFSLYQQAEIIEESRDYRKELSFEEAMLSDAELEVRKNEIIKEKESSILKKELQNYTTRLSKDRILKIIENVDALCKDYSNEIDGKINYVSDMEEKIDDILKDKEYNNLSQIDKNLIKKMVIKRRAFYKLNRHALNLLALGDKYNIAINYVHPDDETALRGNKNAQLRTALSAPETGFVGTSVLIERDAFVSNAFGQSQLCVNAVMDFEKNGYLCLNLPMQAKGSSLTGDDGEPVFPVGYSYAGSIRDWTQGTQSAYDPNLTYYGKGIIRSEGIIAIGWTNPGEDSNSVYINFKAHSLGKQQVSNVEQAIAGYLQYFRLDWIRPTTTNVVGSEARYSSNVFRMLYDPFSTIYEKTKSVGYDWKLSNIMMAAHYVNSILTVIFALFLPLAVIFSSFAFLMPFMLSFAVSTVLMLAINLTKINAEARQKGDFFVAIKGSLKDIIRYFPFWVAMQPVMALFGINASNGVYKFLNTYKDMKLQQDRNVKGVYEFVGSVGAKIGTAGYILTGLYIMLVVAFTLSNPLAFGVWLGVTKAALGIVGAVIVSSFYILANSAFINGLNSYNVRLDENGKVTGRQIGDTVYVPAAQSIYKAPVLFYHYIWDLLLMLRNEEPKYLNKMNDKLNEKEQLIENTDISLKMINDILAKRSRSEAEQALVNVLTKKYEMSENELKNRINEIKDQVDVELSRTQELLRNLPWYEVPKSPAGQEMDKIAEFLREEIGINEKGNALEGKEVNSELLKQVKEALDIDIRNSFDYNLNRGYENFLEISKNFLHKHPAIKAIFRPVITGVTVAGAFSIISTAVMSFTAFSSTVAPMMVTIFLAVAAIWSLYNLGSAIAKKNSSVYLRLFSIATWVGVPVIAVYFMGISVLVASGALAVLAIPLVFGYLLQKNNIKNTKKEFETKFDEIKESEFKSIVEEKIENKIKNNKYTAKEIEKDFDRVARENFDEALVEFIEKENMKSELSELYNDIETASNARISFFLQQTFNETIGGENGLTNSIVKSVKADKFMKLFEQSDEDKDNDNGGNVVSVVAGTAPIAVSETPILPAGPTANVPLLEEAKVEEQKVESQIKELKKVSQDYDNNKVDENKVKEAFFSIELNANDSKIEDYITRMLDAVKGVYGLSADELSQQLNMIKTFIRNKKNNVEDNASKYLTNDNLNVDRMKDKYPDMIIDVQDIYKEMGDNTRISDDIYVVFSLMMAGIGSSLDRVDLLKALFVLDKKTEEAGNDEKKLNKINSDVETLEFLNYENEYENYVKAYRNDAKKKGFIDEKGNVLEPKQKTKAVDIHLKVKTDNGWKMKSVAEIILDDLIKKIEASGENIAVNFLTNEDSLGDINELLDRKIEIEGKYNGKTYREILVNKEALKATLGEDAADGIDLQKMHPAIQYDNKNEIFNFYDVEYPLGHARHALVQGQQMRESSRSDKNDEINIFGNTDNYKIGQLDNRIINWVHNHNVPVTILVTKKGTKEGNKKGGIPMLTDVNGREEFKIIEIAQVKGDEELENKFQSAENALFNTNTILLSKKNLQNEISKAETRFKDNKVKEKVMKAYNLQSYEEADEFFDTMFAHADLIVNEKEKAGNEYLQLEGASASALMELNNLMYVINGRHLMKLVVLDDESSDEMFGPIKKPEDYYGNDGTLATAVIDETKGEETKVQEEQPVEQTVAATKEQGLFLAIVDAIKKNLKATTSLAGNWFMSLFLSEKDGVNVEMKKGFVDENDNYVNLATIPGVFVSQADIERMKNNEILKYENDEYVLKNKDGEVVAKLNDDNQLTIVSKSNAMNGRRVELKYKAVTVEENDKTVIQFRPFNTGSLSATVFECLDVDTQASLNVMAVEALCNRMSYDMNVVDKLIGENAQNKEKEVNKLTKQIYNSIKKDGNNYSAQEKKMIFGSESNVSHSGMKSVDVEMKNKNSFITVCINAKKAGNDEIVLITSKEDKVITSDEVKYVAEQAFTYGLRASVEINSANIDEVDNYFDIARILGFRFADEDLYNKSSSLVETMQKNGKEVSVKVTDVDKIDFNANSKTVYVIDASKCDFEDETLVEILKDLAKVGRVKLYYDNDKEVTQDQQKQVETIFGKNAKTMIALGKSYITNKFASLFNKNYVSMYFSEGLETDMEDTFNGNINKVVPVIKSLLSKKEFSIEELNTLVDNNSAIFTDRFLKTVNAVINNEDLSADEKIPAIRQFVIGTLINYIESELPNVLEQNSELKNVDFNKINKSAMEQVEYRIMQLLMSGKSLENIVTEVAEQQVSSNKSFAEILNEAYDSEIASEWIKTDMLIKPISDSNVAEAEGAIKALLMDSIKVDSIMEDTLSVGIEGIADILAAA